MGIKAPSEVKFRLIHNAIMSDSNMLTVSLMCRIAGVSRSGYYSWEDNSENRKIRELQDLEDIHRIKEAKNYRYQKGVRGIYMYFLHNGERMNIKKIIRLMRKFGVRCTIRKPNPYKLIAKALKTDNVARNWVKREFTKYGPRKVLLTDITYLFYKGGCCYLSTILDAKTHEILAYQVSENLKIDFVLKTVDDLMEKHGATLDDFIYVHSDRGAHYTSKAFIQKLKDADFIQSMSRKGNCWDNAPQESFFGHMKDEVEFEISKCRTYDDVRYLLKDWIQYYNEERYQWDLLKLSPKQYYTYLTTGYNPIPTYVRNNKNNADCNNEKAVN